MNFWNVSSWWSKSSVAAPVVPKEGIEEGWEHLVDNSLAIVPFVPTESLSERKIVVNKESQYTVEFPDEGEPTVAIVSYSSNESSTIVDISEEEEEDFTILGPMVVDLDTNEVLPSGKGRGTAGTALASAALAAGSYAYTAQVGALVLREGVSYYAYRKMVPQGAWKVTQFFYAQMANRAAANIIGGTIAGVGLTTLANAAAVGITVISVVETGAIVYNCFVNKENRIAPAETIYNVAKKAITFT